jgi:hypothetical protein
LPHATDPTSPSEPPATPKDDWTAALPKPAEPPATSSAQASSVDAWAVGLPDSEEVRDAAPAASSDDAWTLGLPGAPGVPSTPAAAATPASAWTTGLPEASDGPDAPAGRATPEAPATPESAWTTALSATPKEAPPKDETAPAASGKGQHTLADHVRGKPEAIVELFGQLDGHARRLEVTRRIRKRHVEYLRDGRRCVTIEVQRESVLLCLTLDAAAVKASWSSPGVERHPIDIRERDKRHVEYAVRDAAQLDDACRLIDLAYSEPSGPQAKG